MSRREITFTRVEGEPWFEELPAWCHIARGVVDLDPFRYSDEGLVYVAEIERPKRFFVYMFEDSFPGSGRERYGNAARLRIGAWPERDDAQLRLYRYSASGIKTDIEVGNAPVVRA